MSIADARKKPVLEDDEASASPPNRRRDLVENEIYERATVLFAERGFAGTSLQDIADAMGMTRPALYYYVKNKDEILAKLVTMITEDPAERLAEINAQKDVPALERLRMMARAIVVRNVEQPLRFQLITRSESDLPPDLATIHKRGKKKVLAELVAVIEDAIADGAVRPLDARIAAFGVLGMTNWVAFWHHGKDGYDAPAIADALSEMAVRSLAEPEDRKVDGVASALALLRQDLDVLEHAIGDVDGDRKRRKKRT